MAVETYGARALHIALGQVGVKETPAGSNTGPMVKAYQAVCTGGGTGWPWCAALALWAYQQGGAPQPYRSPSVSELRGWYHAYGRTLPSSLVRPGDFVMYDWQGDGIPDHIGLFKRWMDDRHTSFEAVEGNTGVGNDSNGGQVMIRLRYVKNVAMFARPVASRLPAGTRFNPVTGAAKRSLIHRVKAKLPYLGHN